VNELKKLAKNTGCCFTKSTGVFDALLVISQCTESSSLFVFTLECCQQYRKECCFWFELGICKVGSLVWSSRKKKTLKATITLIHYIHPLTDHDENDK